MALYSQRRGTLTTEQTTVIDNIIALVDGAASHVGPTAVFLRAAAGRGKTYLLNTLIAYVRGSSRGTVASATTGIAAMAYPGGQTAHKTFGLPLTVNDDVAGPNTLASSLSLEGPAATALRYAAVIIVDEVSMLHAQQVGIIDRLLQSVTGTLHAPRALC
jgi:tRNA(Met) C34 N-acetyltransferase TmcA